jgi:hypothetical protein
VVWTSWPALQAPRLEADDYRYLHQVRQLSTGGFRNLIETGIVENRWDHLWFVDEPGRVRFFRPTVVLSYGFDRWLWGSRYPFGLTLTNVIVHLACSLLVGFLLHRWLGSGPPAFLSAALFAGLWSHGECIWYVAGRTDSMAALGFLGAFALHVAGQIRPALRWWAIPCFAFGLLTKEIVVAAPLLLLAYDRLVSGRHLSVPTLLRNQWALYATHVMTVAAVMLIKHLALAGRSSDLVYPYLVSPLRPDFLAHVWLQARSYGGNLILTEWTVPVADAATVAVVHGWAGMLLGAALILVAGARLRHDGRLWFLLSFGVLTWLPTGIVYLSERYLYLPSVAYVGMIGLLVASCPVAWRSMAVLALSAYAAFHATELYRKHRIIMKQPGSIRELAGQLEPVRGDLVRGGHLLLVNTPGRLFEAQFIHETLRVLLDDPTLTAEVLTMMPEQHARPWRPGDPFVPAMGAGVDLRRSGEHSLVVEGKPAAPGQRPQYVQDYDITPFAWVRLDRPAAYRTPGLEARVHAGDALGATRLEFVLPKPLEQYQIVVWEADGSNPSEHPWKRRQKARVRLATPHG